MFFNETLLSYKFEDIKLDSLVRFYQTTPLLCFKKQDDGEARKSGSGAEAAAGDASGESRGRDAAIFTPDAKLAPQKLTLMARPGWSRQELKKIVYKQNVNVGEYTREETEGTLGSERLTCTHINIPYSTMICMNFRIALQPAGHRHRPG